MLPSPYGCGLGLRIFSFSRPLLRSLSLRPDDSRFPKESFVDRLQSLGFPPPCYPSYGVLTISPAGLSPAEHASLDWTHNRACSFPAHGFPMFFTPRHALISSPLLLELCTAHNADTDPHSGIGLRRCLCLSLCDVSSSGYARVAPHEP